MLSIVTDQQASLPRCPREARNVKKERSGRLKAAAFNDIGDPIIDGCAGIGNVESKFQSKRHFNSHSSQ